MSKKEILIALWFAIVSVACATSHDDSLVSETESELRFFSCEDECTEKRADDTSEGASMECDREGCMLFTEDTTSYLPHDYVATNTRRILAEWGKRDKTIRRSKSVSLPSGDFADRTIRDGSKGVSFPSGGLNPFPEPVLVDPDCMFDLHQGVGMDHCENLPGGGGGGGDDGGGNDDSCQYGEVDCTLCTGEFLLCTAECLLLPPLQRFACMGVCGWQMVRCARAHCDC